jgi:hypothetical protein
MENCPPGIQTIPGGAVAGRAVVFGIVGPKASPLAADDESIDGPLPVMFAPRIPADPFGAAVAAWGTGAVRLSDIALPESTRHASTMEKAIAATIQNFLRA